MKRMWKAGYARVGLVAGLLIGVAVLASLCLPPFMKTAEAGCNPPPSGPVYNLGVTFSSSPKLICVGCDATFTATADHDVKTNTWSWSGGLGAVTTRSLRSSSYTTHWLDAGDKTVSVSVEGVDPDYEEEPNYPDGCRASATTTLTVAEVTFGAFDHVCTNGPHSTHDVLVTLNPSTVPSPGVTLTISTLRGTGDAVFQDTGLHSTQLLSSATVRISGLTASDEMTNMQLQATVGSCVCTSRIFTVYDVTKLTATEDLHTVNTTNDTTQVDDTNSVFICQTSNDNAIVNMAFTWPTSGADSNRFLWDFVLTNDTTAGSEWTNQNGTYRIDPTNSTWALPSGSTTNREFILRSWYDCENNSTYSSNTPHRKVWVTVVDTPRLILTNTVCSNEVEDVTRIDEPQSDANTVLLCETTNRTAEMQIKFDWLPETVNSNWFSWKILLTNETDTETTQWKPNDTTFETNPVTSTWTDELDVNGKTNHSFKVRAWYDCDHDGAYDADEPHRLLYADVAFFEHIQVFNTGGKETLKCPKDDINSIRLKTREPDSLVMKWTNVNGEDGPYISADGTDDYCPITGSLSESEYPEKMIQLEVQAKRCDCVREVARIHTGCQCSDCKFGSFVGCELSDTNYYLAFNLGDCALWLVGGTSGPLADPANLRWPRERWVDGKMIDYTWDADPYYMKIETDGNGHVTGFNNKHGFVTAEKIGDGFILTCISAGTTATNIVWHVYDTIPGEEAIVEAIIYDPAIVTNKFTKTQTGNTTTLTWDQGSGTRIEMQQSTPDGDHVNRVRTVKDKNANVASVTAEKWRDFGWGSVRIEQVVDPSDAALTTTWTYYTNSVETGKYTRVRSVVNPNGSWTRYDYNTNGLQTVVAGSYLDAPTSASDAQSRVTYYDYTPHVQEPDGAHISSPRTVMETILGVTNSITFYAFTNAQDGARVEVMERAASTSSQFGDLDNLRTVTISNPDTSANTVEARKVRSVQSADGRLDTYAYTNGVYSTNGTPGGFTFAEDPTGTYVRITVIHGTVASPAGIATKTTCDLTIQDSLDRTVAAQTFVYTGGGYEEIDWTQYRLDVNGHLLDRWHSNGSHSEKTWECCGPASDIDENGVRHTYTYDEILRPIISTKDAVTNIITSSVLDPEGRTLKQTTSAGGLSLSTTNTYNLAGQLIQSIDAAGLVTTYSYSNDGLTNTVVTPGGLTNVTVNYPDGHTRYTMENGVVKTTYDYGVNSDGTQWTVTYAGPSGLNSPMWSKTTVDMLGRTILEERSGFGGSVLTTEFLYNSKGQLVKTTTTGSAATLYEYNELGEQIASGLDIDGNDTLNLSGPDRVTESASWYGRADFMSATNEWARFSASAVYVDGSSVPTTNSIQKTRLTGLGSSSDLGLLTSESVSVDILTNSTTSRTYINRSATNMTQVVSYPDSSNSAVSVSINGVLVSSSSKSGVTMTYASDALERQIAVTDPRIGTSTTHYNTDNGRVDYVEDAATNRTSFFYDPDSGRQIAVSNALGYVVNSQFDARGQLIGTWGATYPVAYDFDEFNRMSAMYTYRGASNISSYADILVVKPYMDKTQWKYDEATGLLTNKLYADGNGPRYEYTSDGKLSARIWARPKPGTTNEELRTTYSYTNTTGEMIGIGYGDSNATPDVSFAFNRLGQQVSVTDGQGTRTFTYNDQLQLASETNVMGLITRTYDSLGRSSGFALQNPVSSFQYQVSCGYSGNGRFASLSSVISPLSSNSWTYSYLQNSDLISGWSNGTITIVKSYEPNRNLLTSVDNRANGVTVSRFDYVNDALGRRTQRIDTGSASATNAFAYNPKNEITNAILAANSFGYAYDPIGNRISDTDTISSVTHDYTANSLNQYISITNGGLRTLAYDLDGNLTRSVTLSGVEWVTNDFTWDAENRLTSVISNGTVIASFKYDYMSRRYEKATAAGTNTFVWDGWLPVCELSNPTTGNSATNFCVWGLDLSQSLQGAGGIGGLLSVTKSDGTYFPVADGNGNVSEYLATDGTLVAHYEFDPYGKVTAATGGKAGDFSYRFSSKQWDDESGLSYYIRRYYDPVCGRWLGREPLMGPGAENMYSLVRNSPVSEVDYLGLYQIGSPGSDDVAEYYNQIGLGVETERTELQYVPGSRYEDLVKRYISAKATDAASQQSNMEQDLYNRMVKLCPAEGIVKYMDPAEVHLGGWTKTQCCTKPSCEEQARLYAHAVTKFARMVAFAEWIRFGKVRTGWNPSGRDVYRSGEEGQGMRCADWTTHETEIYNATLGAYGGAKGEASGNLCFRGMVVEAGPEVGSLRWKLKLPIISYTHSWYQLVGPDRGNLSPSMERYDIVIDPWPSGGMQVVPEKRKDNPDRISLLTKW